MDELRIIFDQSSFASYRRLAYKWWYALAEFIDNSTQSYTDHRGELDQAMKAEALGPGRLEVIIATGAGFIRITDNAMGMDWADLQHAMTVGKPPANAKGRGRYGLGMKTAACWIGDLWTISTTKLGSERKYRVTMDVDKIIGGDMTPEVKTSDAAKAEHYTVIEIRKHHRRLRGRTIAKVKDYLKSIYRRDLVNGSMALGYNGEALKWQDFQDADFFQKPDGTPYREEFIFEVGDKEKKVVEGWVGILAKGSRSKAGFSILHRQRLIKGWPDSWRPEEIYGPGGSNDLVNQRLVGEVNLEDFEVSHTKDEINWQGEDEELVGEGLAEFCRDYTTVARKVRKGMTGQEGPTDRDIKVAVQTLEAEMLAPEFSTHLELEETLPPSDRIQQSHKRILDDSVKRCEPSFTVSLGSSTKVYVYLDSKASPNDPYFVHDPEDDDSLHVSINRTHPHWTMLHGSEAVTNYMMHCIYDAVAEWRAARLHRVDSGSIKTLKDAYLRVGFEILQRGEKD